MTRILLLAALLLATPALCQVLHDAGRAGRIEQYRPQSGEDDRAALRLRRTGQVVWQARSRGFEAMPALRGEPRIHAFSGWSGGAYCCWTLETFIHTPRGIVHAGSIALGKRSPERIRLQRDGETVIRVADAAHDFWDYVGSLGADIGPPVPYVLDRQRMAPDAAAMRQTPDAAIGPGCAPLWNPASFPQEPPATPGYASLAEAVASLRAADWSRFEPGRPHPATEAARLALCLIYAGQVAAVPQILAGFPDAKAALRSATERQIAARIACSPLAPTLRRLNPENALILAPCQPRNPDQTAVSAALERG
ncbi:hypothetical protein GXW71_07120 [Roseomonas hellenica]|uniref:Uncharacterized protein n=1 Tax=Plastoroseomonas hellenica TaxID=2687306 RepID=A0ABS5EV11_9PROT|nr:hypothetical protein [Plastoroseomonas hellenica]MBR0664124.1 hypothetical protein [Plastoroseomonas hellenica]